MNMTETMEKMLGVIGALVLIVAVMRLVQRPRKVAEDERLNFSSSRSPQKLEEYPSPEPMPLLAYGPTKRV